MPNLHQMQGCLASGYLFVFGFTVYESFMTPEVAKTGEVPLPPRGEQVLGGPRRCGGLRRLDPVLHRS